MVSSCCCCCSCFFTCLEPDDPVRAVTSRFLSQQSFLCYKIIASIYFLFWCFFWPFGEDIDDAHKFVTFWGWYMAAIYFVVSTVTAYSFLGSPMASDGPVRGTHAVTPHRGNRNQPLSSNTRALLGFQVFSWNVACVGSLVIVTVFWVALFDNTSLTSTDVNAHILIAPVMAIDQLLVATKFERKQMLASFLFSITYVVFNIIFFLTAPEDERVIYGQMDWGESVGNSAAFAAVITFVLVPLGGLIHYCVFRLREFIYETCGSGSRPSSHSDIEKGGVVTAIFSR